MAWVRVDDAFYDHPKFVRLDATSLGLWTVGLAYANRNLTDGWVPARFIKGYGNPAKLVREGLWSAEEDGYRIHDYLDYQESAEKILAKRQAERDRWQARKAGNSKPTPRGVPGGVAAKSEATCALPTPTPSFSSSEIRPEVQRLVDLLADLVAANCDGKRPSVGKAWYTDARLLLDKDGRDFDEIERVMRWATSDSFWRSNILSMPKFREKFDALKLRMGSSPVTSVNGMVATGGWES
jgi:hypothetical protein